MFKKHKLIDGTRVKIGTEEFIVPPLSFRGIKNAWPVIDKLSKIDTTDGSPIPYNEVVDFIIISLKPNYPRIKRNKILGLLTLTNFEEVLNGIMEASGLKKTIMTPQA